MYKIDLSEIGTFQNLTTNFKVHLMRTFKKKTNKLLTLTNITIIQIEDGKEVVLFRFEYLPLN